MVRCVGSRVAVDEARANMDSVNEFSDLCKLSQVQPLLQFLCTTSCSVHVTRNNILDVLRAPGECGLECLYVLLERCTGPVLRSLRKLAVSNGFKAWCLCGRLFAMGVRAIIACEDDVIYSRVVGEMSGTQTWSENSQKRCSSSFSGDGNLSCSLSAVNPCCGAEKVHADKADVDLTLALTTSQSEMVRLNAWSSQGSSFVAHLERVAQLPAGALSEVVIVGGMFCVLVRVRAHTH
jgi:hypothetical protein